MKTQVDPRHQKRQKTIQELFALGFHRQRFNQEITGQIINNLKTIDRIISKAAPVFPIDKISRIDLSILRLAVYELQTKKAPSRVIIDEAVELAKEFGGDTSYSFINGVLGTILKKKYETNRP